ncbi:predicted protein [Uncinocarpus reesii 1704]|uniref:F-box domain-containing protein n=1 Tax=Uncinocarpus reesii (strain UAMH 1704) TaxID=336963 RepID=C4JU80_UNCRE|nr:uncharacterized protein UREG_06019 [Uncinocarpus reesii 1704]EEP81177.1 predicted protein [Uncinocarpus reesii 1704]
MNSHRQHDRCLPSSLAHSPTAEAMDGPKQRAQDNSNSSAPSLIDLPTDIHVQLVSYLDFRDLQMLRATSTYFRSLFSESEITKARRDYIQALQQKEVDEVLMDQERKLSVQTLGAVPENNEPDLRLTCYTCLRLLSTQNFADTQVMRRRRKGHADAWKRFCNECAIQENRWEPGITLSFQRRTMIYCRRCRAIRRVPANETLRTFGLCQDCCDDTGISRFEKSYIFDWYEAKMLIDRFFSRYNSSRVVVTEEDWLQLENELSKLGQQT